jgi:hypothetical protein
MPSLTWVCSHGGSARIGPCRMLLWSGLVVSQANLICPRLSVMSATSGTPYDPPVAGSSDPPHVAARSLRVFALPVAAGPGCCWRPVQAVKTRPGQIRFRNRNELDAKLVMVAPS